MVCFSVAQRHNFLGRCSAYHILIQIIDSTDARGGNAGKKIKSCGKADPVLTEDDAIFLVVNKLATIKRKMFSFKLHSLLLCIESFVNAWIRGQVEPVWTL